MEFSNVTMLYIADCSKTPDRDSRWIKSFELKGINVHVISIEDLVKYSSGLKGKIERRLHIGKKIDKLRKYVLTEVYRIKPDWVHFRSPLQFDLDTISEIKKSVKLLTQYCNDDPFSPRRVKFHWHNFFKTISLFDANFVYRLNNVQEFVNIGGKNVLHLSPCYVPWQHYPPDKLNIVETEDYKSDALFIGHWENDNRVEHLDYLLTSSYNVKIFGSMWKFSRKYKNYNKLLPIKTLFGEEYNKAYSMSIAGLCFFSKLNRDKLTERVFEIPAVGGLLVCERTNEVVQYFEDRKEAFFFSNKVELRAIVDELTSNSSLREQVAKAGQLRLKNGKNSILDKVDIVLEFIVSNSLI